MNNRFLTPDHSEDHSQTIQLLELSAIRCDCGTQIRAAINESTVAEYAEAMLAGATFPAITVFHDGSQYVLADGFHRMMATVRCGTLHISADVRPGTKADALKFALSANAVHGLKRSNADKRRSVELALAEWPKLSNREIARICAVHHDHVRDVRNHQLADSASSNLETRVGADGKERPVRRVRPSCIPAPNGAPAPDQNIPKPVEPSGPLGLKSEVKYHMELVRADAETILVRLEGNLIEPDDLKDCAVELKSAAKKVEALKRQLESVSSQNSN